MTYETTRDMLKRAQKKGYAIGHFNTSNLEFTKVLIQTAEEMNAPIIIGASTSAIKYADVENLVSMAKNMAKRVHVPVALHLDHGPSLKWIQMTADAGFSSVMFDGSHYDYDENIRKTKINVAYAHKKKIPIEAELGALEGVEDDLSVAESVYTNPLQAKDFVKQTKVDSLAVSIGTSHGAYKFSGASQLDLKRLKDIDEEVRIPLVLHGASSVPQQIVRLAQKFGAKLGNAKGVNPLQIKKAVRLGVCKVNTDTDLRIAYDAGMREFLHEHPEIFDPRKMNAHAMEHVRAVVKYRIKLFLSDGKY